MSDQFGNPDDSAPGDWSALNPDVHSTSLRDDDWDSDEDDERRRDAAWD
jgi:hypothetical protein